MSTCHRERTPQPMSPPPPHQPPPYGRGMKPARQQCGLTLAPGPPGSPIWVQAASLTLSFPDRLVFPEPFYSKSTAALSFRTSLPTHFHPTHFFPILEHGLSSQGLPDTTLASARNQVSQEGRALCASEAAQRRSQSDLHSVGCALLWPTSPHEKSSHIPTTQHNPKSANCTHDIIPLCTSNKKEFAREP